MASVKYKGKWMELSSLPLEALIELGLSKDVKIELKKVPKEVKKSPVKEEKEND